MKTIQHFRNLALVAISLMALSACAGMSQQETSTAVGAGVGAVGGAAVGGIVGHEIAKDKK